MAIITMSHEIGAGGPEIGQQLADRLGYRYVDQDLVTNAAQKYGLLEEKLSHPDESKPSLFERFDAETRPYITVIQTALYDFPEQDKVALMGCRWRWPGIRRPASTASRSRPAPGSSPSRAPRSWTRRWTSPAGSTACAR